MNDAGPVGNGKPFGHLQESAGHRLLGKTGAAFLFPLVDVGRQVQGAPLFDLQMVQGHIADMALDVDAAALLRDVGALQRDLEIVDAIALEPVVDALAFVLLHDPEDDVREEAARALGLMST